MTLIRQIVLALIVLLQLTGVSYAKTLAVFPFLDITQDHNGINPPLTEAVRQKASEYGFSVVPDSEVMNFMVRHRIRSLGTLTTYDIINLRQELGVDYALVGTVCQLDDKQKLKISLSLQLERTSDEEVVWSVIKVLHKNDLISLLGLWDPDTLDDIYEEYFPSLFDSIMTEMLVGKNDKPRVGILKSGASPAFLKPDQRTHFSAQVYLAGPVEKLPSFNLKVADNSIPIIPDEDSHFLKADFQAPPVDGSYPVDLVADFGSGNTQTVRAGIIHVDSIPPEVTMDLLGTTINGQLYFGKTLKIIPRLAVPERLSGWEISVFNRNDEMIVFQETGGNLPTGINWNGMTSLHDVAPDGLYKLKLTVRDLAGNQDEVEQSIRKQETNPQLNLEVTETDGKMRIVLQNEVKSAALDYWWVKVFETQGKLLKVETGEKLPATFEIPLPDAAADRKIELIANVQDRLGNRTEQRFVDIMNLGPKDEEPDIVPETQWLENF